MLKFTKEVVYKEVVKALGKVDSNGSWDTLLEECDYDIDRAVIVAFNTVARILKDDILPFSELNNECRQDKDFYLKQLVRLGRCIR